MTDPIEAIAEKIRPHGRVVVRRYSTTVEIALDRMDGERWVDTMGIAVLTDAGRLVNVIGGELASILGVLVGPQGADYDEREDAARLDPGCRCGHSREMHQDGTGACAYCATRRTGELCGGFRPEDDLTCPICEGRGEGVFFGHASPSSTKMQWCKAPCYRCRPEALMRAQETQTFQPVTK